MAYVGNPIDTQNTFQSLAGKRFNGDGSTTDFTLDVAPGSVLDIEVFVGNVRQDPNSAYTLSGTTLSFTGAPPSGTNNIYVVHQAKSVGTIDVPALGVSTASIQADAITEAKIADDAVESEHLNNNIISGQTELAATPALTDELLISDGGTIKRIDFTHLPTHVLLSDTYISSSTATVTYSSSLITDDFEQYIITGSGIQMASSGGGNLQLVVSTDNGSNYYTTDGNYKRTVQVGQTGVSANTTINRAGNDAVVGITGNGYDFGGGVAYGNCGFVVRCYNLRNLDTGSGARRLFDVRSSYADKDSSDYVYNSGTHFFGGATGEINNLKIQCSHSNTIGEGEFRLYGVK